ncbi:hypothetical protein GCM10023115_54980 [Pontixanthobacter gangjinensis]|uniref:DUF2339 domain-containing protein n=1 Tax=Pontixanthobacter gangjinensis TaxID=1028742 RepID=A0A6I4SS54_9SPHN|nr:DUF2339 domain-containing protein [Pontixanthobacter gangjinensis]MXO57777.1 DUF2339 domain-containing protein [Pontixanthobacter gangjinensis]
MEILLLVLLGGALVYLWRRSDALEANIRSLEEQIDSLRRRLPVSQPSELKPGEAGVARGLPLPVPAAPMLKAKAQAKTGKVAGPIPASRMAAEAEDLEEAKPEPAEPTLQFKVPFKLPGPKFDFEDVFGRLLPIWAGGITLAIAGFFLVKYSIESGLLGPQVRVALGFLFGTALLGGAEAAYRNEGRISDPRVRQALAGAGLATMYANFYLAGSLYGLVGSTISFLGMAGVTGAAIALSFRFGLPSAILGLIGGFAAPMLVGSDQANLPILALYLSLVTGGLTYAGNRQGRSWLGLAALAGGLGWGCLMLLTSITGTTDMLAFGGFMVVLGAIVPALARTDDADDKTEGGLGAHPILRTGAAALAALQLAAMIQQSAYSMLGWGLFGLLASALAVFAWREPRLREASAFAGFTGLVMLGLWHVPTGQNFALVAAAFAAIFAGVPIANIWRKAHRTIDSYQIAGFSFGLMAVTLLQFGWAASLPLLTMAMVAISVLPIAAAWLGWQPNDKPLRLGALANCTIATLGLTLAGLIATPAWMAPLVLAAIALGATGLCWRRQDRGLFALACFGSVLTLIALLISPGSYAEAARLGGQTTDADMVRGVIRWIAAALPFLAFAIHARIRPVTYAAEAIATILAYGAAAQMLSGDLLAWCAALIALALAALQAERKSARLTATFVALLWAAEPLSIWIMEGLAALYGEPMLIAGDLAWRVLGLDVAPLMVALALLIGSRSTGFGDWKWPIMIAFGMVTAVAGHIAFKQILALQSSAAFINSGLAERTIWGAMLLGPGLAIARFAAAQSWAKPVSIALYGIALAHFAIFTLGWHNPLWSQQAVGPWPAANLLIPAYLVGGIAIVLLAEAAKSLGWIVRCLFDAALMLLIGLMCLSELRHLFAGTILDGLPVGQTEDLLRSLVGILVAIGFLIWGTRKHSRSWRVGSLVLMLGAVLKVFLFDANGLEGLIRIASFVALGFSLIGIGWFYARQLRSEEIALPDHQTS